jgi:hypothetical protein
MKDWRTYFKSRLTDNGQFTFENLSHRGQTDTLTFKSTSDSDSLTTIEVGILDNGDLITFEFHNPRTPGYSEQQRREYFYRYSFHPTETSGGPGLEFIKLNIDHFDKLLHDGLKGREVQYYIKGKLIKSEVFQSYSGNNYNDYGTTIRFHRKGIWRRLLDTFISRISLYDKIIQIELKEVFGGLSSG